MKRINLSFISILILMLVFATVMSSVFINFDNKSISTKHTKHIEDSLTSVIALCYALEGKYPDDIYYIQNNYGFQIDEERYIYHYEKFAANIMPDIRVFVKPNGGK